MLCANEWLRFRAHPVRCAHNQRVCYFARCINWNDLTKNKTAEKPTTRHPQESIQLSLSYGFPHRWGLQSGGQTDRLKIVVRHLCIAYISKCCFVTLGKHVQKQCCGIAKTMLWHWFGHCSMVLVLHVMRMVCLHFVVLSLSLQFCWRKVVSNRHQVW